MCGICIWVNKRGKVDAGRLARATMLMRRRGPDAQRMVLLGGEGLSELRRFDDLAAPPGGEGVVGLAHARLRIIDLSTCSEQPFERGGRDFLVFNGEIYNYRERREELRARHGARFASKGDTEALLAGLMLEGPDSLAALNGMWAFAHLNLDRRAILLGRDRYGKKPLYYYHDHEHFIAASECKCIYSILGAAREVDRSFLDAFVALKWYPLGENPAFLYRGVRLAPPGGTLHYCLDSHSVEVRQAAPEERFGADTPDPEAFAGEFASAVDLRLRADVPVGVLVSGGVDSTAICAQARSHHNLRYYTAITTDSGGKVKQDLGFSRQVAQDLGVELREVDLAVRPENFLEDFRFLTRRLELPLNPFLVAYPGYLIYKAMARDGIRVALDGTGGDEVMGGYPAYLNMIRYNLERRGRLLEAFRVGREHQLYQGLGLGARLLDVLKGLKRILLRPQIMQPSDHTAAGLARVSTVPVDLAPALGRHYLDQECTLGALQAKALLNGAIPYYLVVNDAVSMANSIENRSPFLDWRLFKYLRMDDRWKFRDGMNKFLLRSSIPERVRAGVRWRKNKEGFGYSPGYFMNANQESVEGLVMGSGVLRQLYDVESVRKAWRAGTDPNAQHFMRSFFFIALLDEAFQLHVT